VTDLADRAVAAIDRQELIDLTLRLCNIDSAGPHEGEAAEAVYDWLRREGFKARKVALFSDRPNILGTLPGSGGGCSLLFNSHLDTAVQTGDTWVQLDAADDVYHRAWIEGDELVGEGVVNDKGPLCAFLVAAKAVRSLGVPLTGDLLLTAVVGETSHEPAPGEPHTLESAEAGVRFLVTHGGVADYALVAEGTGFSIVSVEAGMAWWRLTWLSDQPSFYTPYLPERGSPAESPNMIVRAAAAVAVLEAWAAEYQRRWTRELGGGVVVPKAQVAAIKAGDPTRLVMTPQVCSLYLGAFIPPEADPLAIRDEFIACLAAAGLAPSEVDLYLHRRGYEARGTDRLREALLRAHGATFGSEPPAANPATSSMWRDINVFSEVGIPAVTYGPRSETHSCRRAFKTESLYQAACLYARLIVDVYNQPKEQGGLT